MARNFLRDPIEDNVIAEFDDAGSLIVEYTTEPELYGDVISQRRDGETHCFYSDGLGSTTEVTNAAGDTIATRAYTAFGETTESTGSVVFPFQFIGQKGYYLDNETETYSIRRRQYEPLISRWTSVDPLGEFSGASAYMYSDNAPIYQNDPSGLLSQEIATSVPREFAARNAHLFGAPEVNGPCLSYSVITQWVLDADEQKVKKGLIIQKVTTVDSTLPCNPRDDLSAKGARCRIVGVKNRLECRSSDYYYEVWGVTKGNVYQNLDGKPSIYNFDIFAHGGFNIATKGGQTKTGEALAVSKLKCNQAPLKKGP